MRTTALCVVVAVACLFPVPVLADPASVQFRKELEALKKQMQEMQHTIKEQQKTINTQQETIEKMEKTAAKPVELPPAQKEQLRKEITQELAREESKIVTPQPVPARGRGFGGMEPFARGIQSMNPEISIDGLFAGAGSTESDFEDIFTGAHDPNQRGFTLQNLELTLGGAVDPYFRGDVHLVYQLNNEGESTFELEEAYLTSLSLPYNLQLKAGQFFTQFGRLNPTHPHTWDFVDQPLVNGRMFGGDGLRNPGTQFSYLLPLPFYLEAITTVQNSQGETAYSFRNVSGEELFGRTLQATTVRGLDDMLWVPRLRTSFNLSDTQTLLLGTSFATGPNASGQHTRTNIYGFDLYWRWKPLNNFNGWPFVSFQTEAMFRDYQAGQVLNETSGELTLPRQTLKDWGTYAQILWGFSPRWVAGLRFDYVEGSVGNPQDYLNRDRRLRYAPNITFYPSEFSKWRLQYNFDDEPDRGRHDHTVVLQWEFLLGAHGAHAF